MKRAFTLLELMVVVGIMAFLGIASASSYSALKHGMAERSTVEAVSALLKAAKERALVDRVPTAVFCWNLCVREATDDEDAAVAGEIVAVRRAGRITYIDGGGKYLYDEFGDLDRAYDSSDEDKQLEKMGGGFRLWYMSDSGNASMKFSTVASGVRSGDLHGKSYLPWSVSPPSYDTRTAKTLFGQGYSDDGVGDKPKPAVTEFPAYAFYNLNKGGHEPAWRVGSAYGTEFQRLRLPEGFTFGGDDPPTKFGAIKDVKAISFNPNGNVGNGDVVISFCRADGNGVPRVVRTVGKASSEERREEGQ